MGAYPTERGDARNMFLWQVFAFGVCGSGEAWQDDRDAMAEGTLGPIYSSGYYRYSISNTTTLSVHPSDDYTLFIFCSPSTNALRVRKSQTWWNMTRPPFAFDMRQWTPEETEITVETDVTTDVILFLLPSEYYCTSGAYLLAGGVTVEMQALENATQSTSYCVFSPSSDDQELEVTYGLSKYFDRKQSASLLYYTDLQEEEGVVRSHSSHSMGCMHRGTCKKRLENAAFFVQYSVLANTSVEMFYSRKNLRGSDKFCECTDAQIPFTTVTNSWPVPFDTFWAKKKCEGSKIGVYIGIGVGCVLGLSVLIAVFVLILNPKAREKSCRCFRQKHFADESFNASFTPCMEADGSQGVVRQRTTFQTE